MDSIDITNGVVSFHINDTSLLSRDNNSILSTSKAHGFDIADHEANKYHSNKYIFMMDTRSYSRI